MATEFPPTDQQVEAIAAFRMGLQLRVEARAGAGKTSTLRLMGQATKRAGQYTAFNRDLVMDASQVMPDNVACATMHRIAMRQVGRHYRHRLDSKRMRSAEVARKLRIDSVEVTTRMGKKRLAPGMLASLVQSAITRFCQSADPEPTVEHIRYIEGIDPRDERGGRTFDNNNVVREHLRPALALAWQDIVSTTGELRFSHDHYLKIWQMGVYGKPRIAGDFILFDEAQDASPVMLDAIRQQDAQLVVVGDSEQAIYEWRGAVNALALVPAEATAYLTRSFRFGHRIAEVANLVLDELGAKPPLQGCDVDSVVRPVDEARAVLCRSNAEAVKTVLRHQEKGIPVHLVGDGTDVAAFARAVKELEETGWTSHPELSCFTSWKEVQEYVEQDPQGSELALLVKLVQEFTVETILKALEHMPSEATARVIVSTAHKSKGREWESVKIASDFPEPEGDGWEAEYRLLYVAATRGRRLLDPYGCDVLHGLIDPDWKIRMAARKAFDRPFSFGPNFRDDEDDEILRQRVTGLGG